jgi:hypothetical protein
MRSHLKVLAASWYASGVMHILMRTGPGVHFTLVGRDAKLGQSKEEGRMPQSKDEVKAHVMREAEELIDKLLAEKPPAEEISLSDIEQTAVEAGLGFGQAIARRLVKTSPEQKEDKPVCRGCGERMKLKDYRTRRVETEAGEVELKRAYYYCQVCGRGVFPPG